MAGNRQTWRRSSAMMRATGGTGASTMVPVSDHEARIAAAREAAARRGFSLVINARTDTFLLGLGESMEDRVAMTIARGEAYLAAGADLVFVPGLIDPDGVRRVADAFTGRLSLMALPVPRQPTRSSRLVPGA